MRYNIERLCNQNGAVAFEQVMISAVLVCMLGGTFATLSANIDSGIQRSQGVYSASHIQPQDGDSRPEFGLVSASNNGATVVPEVEEQATYEPDGLDGPSAADFESLVENSIPALQDKGVMDQPIFKDHPGLADADEGMETVEGSDN